MGQFDALPDVFEVNSLPRSISSYHIKFREGWVLLIRLV